MTKTVKPFYIAALWFGIQLAWGAVLGISLQARTLQLTGTESLVLFGVVSTAGAFAAAIAQLTIGFFSDVRRRNGDKRIGFYVAGIAIAAVALLAFYLAPTVPTFTVAYIVLQLAMNVAIGPYQAIIPDFVPKERIGVASGWMAAMQSGGNAAGAIAATVLGNTPQLGLVIALLLVISGVLTIRHLREIPLQPIESEARLRLSMPLIDLFISRAFVYLGFYTLLLYFYFYVRSMLHQPFMTDPNTAAGICVLLFTLVGAAGAAIVAKPSDRFDERLIVSIGCAIMALCVAALAYEHSLILIPILISIAGIGWGIFLCADWAYACRLLPAGSLAWTMALWNIAVVGPQMAAPLIATGVIKAMQALDPATGPRVAFAIACIELLVGAVWIWRLPKRSIGN
jgi:MFS family permease